MDGRDRPPLRRLKRHDDYYGPTIARRVRLHAEERREQQNERQERIAAALAQLHAIRSERLARRAHGTGQMNRAAATAAPAAAPAAAQQDSESESDTDSEMSVLRILTEQASDTDRSTSHEDSQDEHAASSTGSLPKIATLDRDDSVDESTDTEIVSDSEDMEQEDELNSDSDLD